MQTTAKTGTEPTATAADAKRCIKKLRTRFERWELTHLRELAAELHQRLEEAEMAAIDADRRADMFMDMCKGMQDELQGAGVAMGITQDGRMGLVRTRMVCDDFGQLIEVAQ